MPSILKWTLLGAGIVAIVGAAVLLTIPPSNPSQNNGEINNTGTTGYGTLRATTQLIQATSSEPAYSVEVQYPRIVADRNQEQLADMNAAIAQQVNKAVNEFTQRVTQRANEQPERSPRNEFAGSYEIAQLSPQLVSIRYTVSEYLGGAHPTPIIFTFNYLPDKNKRIQLADIFRQESDYLSRLSELSRTQLLEERTEEPQLNPEWVREGTQPAAENFERFTLTDTHLVIHFEPYQVAPYAAGLFTATIPPPEISDITRPKGPIQYIK